MSNLKAQLVKLGSDNKELRPHIRPLLAQLEKEAAPRREESKAENKEKARVLYEKHRKKVDNEVKELEKHLKRHNQRADKDPSYGSANEMGRVLDLLEEINKFLNY